MLQSTSMEEVQENQSTEEQEERREITVQTMLESGAHFGHKTAYWNPKMAPYLHGSRNGVYIFNLDRTFALWRKAREKIVDTVSNGGNILLVGPKKQCSEVLEREAKRCGSFYISHKWVGGLLTNFDTVRKSIKEMKKIRETLGLANSEDSDVNFTKKEKLLMQEELDKLERKFGGIEDMTALPDMIFIVDIVRYKIVVDEARKLHIPIIGILEGREEYEARLQARLDTQVDEVTDKAEDLEDIEVQKKDDKGRKVTKRKKADRRFPKKRKIASGITFYSAEYFENNIKNQ